MTLTLLRDWTAAGAGARHARLLLRQWLAGAQPSPEALPRCVVPPAKFLSQWPMLCAALEDIARIASRHPSADGSQRLLVRLQDGRTVESVLLARDAACISTQVGCAVGCRFCKTGEAGLLRQLSAEELLAQVALAQRERRARGMSPLRKIVLMGMGEPAHNLPAVLVALAHLGDEGGFGHKQLVFSTVGDRRAFAALSTHAVKPALALSLHTLDDAVREHLLPRAQRIPARELLALALDFARGSGHPLQIQWTLLSGLNDSSADVASLIEALRGERAIVNVIPWNPLEGMGFERPKLQTSIEFVRALKRGGVFSTIRRSAGADVDGACGQLRSRALDAAAEFAKV